MQGWSGGEDTEKVLASAADEAGHLRSQIVTLKTSTVNALAIAVGPDSQLEITICDSKGWS